MTIEVLNESGAEVDEQELLKVATHALERLGVSGELSLLLVDVERMTELHLQWMDLDGPTDVMAFPMDELDLRGARRAGASLRTSDDDVLGDIVLCPAVASQQAATAGHSTADELALLTTHGVLHLLGYDHEEPDEHAEMFGLQGELLASYRGETG
jgi:probable rRNA maturation factor